MVPVPSYKLKRGGGEGGGIVEKLNEGVTYMNQLADITLWSCKFCGIFNLQQDNEVQIMPHVVLLLDMLIKGHRLILK